MLGSFNGCVCRFTSEGKTLIKLALRSECGKGAVYSANESDTEQQSEIRKQRATGKKKRRKKGRERGRELGWC